MGSASSAVKKREEEIEAETIAPLHQKIVELEDTGHNDVPYKDPTRYLSEVASFLTQL